jgi:ubiquinol-cytochrome c reductase cytochrome b subunit
VNDNLYLWLVRDLHAIGANIVVSVIIIHASKALCSEPLVPARAPQWIAGVTILILSLGIAFTGYAILFGQMSY